MNCNEQNVEFEASDIFKDYLNKKLVEFEFVSSAANDKLKEAEQSETLCLDYLKSNVQCDDADVQIIRTWSAIYKKSWIIGICTRNAGHRPLKNNSIILESDSKDQIQYSIKLYTKYKREICEELDLLRNTTNSEVSAIVESLASVLEHSGIEDEWILTEELKNESTIIIITDIPDFINHSSIKLQGILTYEKLEKIFQLTIPDIQLTINDLLIDKYMIKSIDIINGNVDCYLGIISTAKITIIKIILPKIFRSLAGILQIDCNFTKAAIIGASLMLVYDGICENLKESMLEVYKDEESVKLITRDEDQLNILYHHLYKNIPDVILLNEDCHQIPKPNDETQHFLTRPTQNTTLNASPVKQSNLATMAGSLERQMTFLEEKLQKFCVDEQEDIADIHLNHTDYKQFRKELNDFEKETNYLYSNICKQN